uniref:Uncharacterized protein n=1 Tax=Pseudomonas phage Cygsa01 TaxID=3138529 RepID=A0AAU6W4K7_9VIRU
MSIVSAIVALAQAIASDVSKLAPAYHPGLVAGRYYMAPYLTLANSALSANTMYFSPVMIPHKCTVSELGGVVTTGATGNCRFALFKVAKGVLTLVAQTGDISTATAGVKSGSVSATVEAGTYFLAILCSGTPTINVSAAGPGFGGAERGAFYGQSAPTNVTSSSTFEALAQAVQTYGTIPSGSTSMSALAFVGSQLSPHLFYRISA